MKSQTASGGSVAAGPLAASKKEKIVPQATAEQLRIAEITNVSSEQDSAELHKSIKKIVEFTGRSQDEAAMALHDSNGDVQEAINILLEQSADAGGWETSGKKKKEKPPVEVSRKEDSRRSAEDRGMRNRPRGPKTGTAPPTRGKTTRVPGQRFGRENRPAAPPGAKTGRRNVESQQNSNEENNWNNGQSEFEEQPIPKEEENSGQADDTIGNMGNWDDFKADQKTSEWSDRKKTDWADVAAGTDGSNRDWKSRQRQPQAAKPKSADVQQPSKPAVQNEVVQQSQNVTATRVAAPPTVTSQTARTKVRLPPTSKIPQTPVEMPPDHLDMHGGNSLDVTFGGLSFGSNTETITAGSPQNHHQTSKVDQHNGTSLPAARTHLQSSTHQTANVQVPHLKSAQPAAQQQASFQDVPKPLNQLTSVPPGLDKSSVNPQTHKSISQTTTNPVQPSQYHTQQQSQSQQQTSGSNYQQYSSSYKAPATNANVYLHSLYNMGQTSQYSQPTGQYGNASNYGTSFAQSSSGNYKKQDNVGINNANSSSGVSDSATSGYDKKSNMQQQHIQSGGMVLQTGHMPGHMHAATPYAHLTSHPAIAPLYSYYAHAGHVPPQANSGTHMPTDYQQGQRETGSTASGASAAISNSLLQSQQHPYDKFVRSQDDSSSGSAATQGSTSGSQSTITATANYAHMGPYNIYYGTPMVTPQGTFPTAVPYMSAQVAAGYPATGNANSSSQPSKTSSVYGANNSFDYQLGHISSPAADYNKYQSNKMMSNSSKYISATTASERR